MIFRRRFLFRLAGHGAARLVRGQTLLFVLDLHRTRDYLTYGEIVIDLIDIVRLARRTAQRQPLLVYLLLLSTRVHHRRYRELGYVKQVVRVDLVGALARRL